MSQTSIKSDKQKPWDSYSYTKHELQPHHHSFYPTSPPTCRGCFPSAPPKDANFDPWEQDMLFVGVHFAGFTIPFLSTALGVNPDTLEEIYTHLSNHTLWANSSSSVRDHWILEMNPEVSLHRYLYYELIDDIILAYCLQETTYSRRCKKRNNFGSRLFFECHLEQIMDRWDGGDRDCRVMVGRRTKWDEKSMPRDQRSMIYLGFIVPSPLSPIEELDSESYKEYHVGQADEEKAYQFRLSGYDPRWTLVSHSEHLPWTPVGRSFSMAKDTHAWEQSAAVYAGYEGYSESYNPARTIPHGLPSPPFSNAHKNDLYLPFTSESPPDPLQVQQCDIVLPSIEEPDSEPPTEEEYSLYPYIPPNLPGLSPPHLDNSFSHSTLKASSSFITPTVLPSIKDPGPGVLLQDYHHFLEAHDTPRQPNFLTPCISFEASPSPSPVKAAGFSLNAAPTSLSFITPENSLFTTPTSHFLYESASPLGNAHHTVDQTQQLFVPAYSFPYTAPIDAQSPPRNPYSSGHYDPPPLADESHTAECMRGWLIWRLLNAPE
ncbi:MAG: hypothetical protein Q9173_001681 [Seirophora scorigena]